MGHDLVFGLGGGRQWDLIDTCRGPEYEILGLLDSQSSMLLNQAYQGHLVRIYFYFRCFATLRINTLPDALSNALVYNGRVFIAVIYGEY
jgi:hypothetical protein